MCNFIKLLSKNYFNNTHCILILKSSHTIKLYSNMYWGVDTTIIRESYYCFTNNELYLRT